MTIQWVAKVLELGPEVSGCRRLVLLSLANHANEDGYAWPGRELIAAEAGVARVKTVTEHLGWLVDHGFITRTVNGWAGEEGNIPRDARPNLYRLIEGPAWAPSPYFEGRRGTRKTGSPSPEGVPAKRVAPGTRFAPEGVPVSRPRGYPQNGYLTIIEPSLEPSCRNECVVSPAPPQAASQPVEHRNDVRPTPPPEPVSPFRPEAERLANLLADACAASPPGSKRPTVTKAWVDTMERTLRLDERTPEQVARCIEWVFTNPAADFWVPNIRSPQKLRAQYDRLRADAVRATRGPVASQALVDAADSFYGLREAALAKAVADGRLVRTETGDYVEPEPQVQTIEEQIAELAAAGDERGLQDIFDRWPHLGRQYYGLPEPDYSLGATT